MNTLQGQPVDRPPVLAVLGAYGGRLTGVPLPELYTDANKYVAGQQAVIDAFGIDMALTPFDFSAIAEAFGGTVAFFDHQPPNMKRPGIPTIAEALTVPMPDPQATGRLPLILDATRKLSALYKGNVPIFACLPGPAALPALMLGMETWVDTVLFNEAAARKILKRSGEFWVAWANALLDAGADALVVAEGMAPASITTRKLFEEKCLPHIRNCFAGVNGPLVFHHNGGKISHIMDLLPTLPNLAGVSISSKDSLPEARAALGPETPLLGNVDSLVFPMSTPDEIRKRASVCLNNSAQYSPFILCTSSGDIPIETPPETIQAFAGTAKELSPPSPAALPIWVTCGVLSDEITELHRHGAISGDLLILDSMLHMDPPELELMLLKLIADTDRPLILVYGDCCPGMLQLANRPNVTRVKSINCCQMLLGKERFRELMRSEAFMLLPEWTPRWKEILEKELGLTHAVSMELFKENRKELVYLDTGVRPIPHSLLDQCAADTGLPVRIEKPGLVHLKKVLQKAENESRENLPHGTPS